MGGKVTSIQQAGVILGQKTLGEVVTIAGTSSLLGDSLKGYDLEPGDLWRHSLGVAFGSRIIAKKQNSHLAVDAFTAGLLHDSGKLILDPYVFEHRERFREYLADGQQDFLSAEKEILGFDHSEIASEVCKSWDIPKNLTTAIKYHHNPSCAKDSDLTYIVHVADAIAMMTGLGLGMDGMTYQMDPKAMEITGIKEKNISHIMAEVLESVQKMD
jgi:HD-like signal output (HDOD) protein